MNKITCPDAPDSKITELLIRRGYLTKKEAVSRWVSYWLNHPEAAATALDKKGMKETLEEYKAHNISREEAVEQMTSLWLNSENSQKSTPAKRVSFQSLKTPMDIQPQIG